MAFSCKGGGTGTKKATFGLPIPTYKLVRELEKGNNQKINISMNERNPDTKSALTFQDNP